MPMIAATTTDYFGGYVKIAMLFVSDLIVPRWTRRIGGIGKSPKMLAIFAGKTMQAFFFEFVKIIVAYLLPLALIAGALVFVAWGIAFIRDELE